MKLKLPFVLSGMLWLCGFSADAQEYQHLTVTSGFNHDVIANGVGPALNSSTIGVDNANYAFPSNDFQQTAGSIPPAYGLPATGLIVSAATPTISYQLGNYSENNSLRIATQNTSGTLNFSNNVSATKLYILATSGSGISTMTGVITFTDNTTQAITTATVPDWFNSTTLPVAASGFGRVSRTTGTVENPSGNPRMFQLMITIDLANTTKDISSIQFTKTSAIEGAINIFAITAELVGQCPSLNIVSAATASMTSANINWTLASAGENATAVTYMLEVSTDPTYATQITGSPFTGITANTYAVTGLTFGTQYYYRLKANNGICDSATFASTFTLAYCLPSKTGASTLNYINNVTTTGGYTNIANTTPNSATAGYTNYEATQIVSKPAGTTFNYSITRSSATTSIGVWIDWNMDLDFDDANETVAIYTGAFGQPTVLTGSITIPAGTTVGNYKLRIRSVSSASTVAPCGALPTGEAEDYAIAVVTPPADCLVPDAPSIALSDVTASGIVGTVTSSATAPTGYILVRSNAPLTAQPATGATYLAGSSLGGGTVLSVSPTLTGFTEFVNANTHYYYTAYAYNENGSACFGPIYSTPATANAYTCAVATVVIGASDVTAATATINWTSVTGNGGATATYTLEVYSDIALTNLLNTYTTNNTTYSLTGLTNGNTYYFRVKAVAGTCGNDAWSTGSFTAQNNYTPISVTGFNSDVIANGNGIASMSTTGSVDAANFAYLAQNYKPNATTTYAYGLPVNRVMNSATAGLTYFMQDYSGNNSLRIAAQGVNGTLTFAMPLKLSDLYLAVTSGNGGAGITAEILFSDGTSQLTPAITLINWDSAASVAIPALANGINLGRVDRASTTGLANTGNFKVFQVSIAIDAANQNKLITGVKITKTGIGALEPVANIFAVSGKVINDCPILETASATSGGTISYTPVATAGAPTSYTVEVYTDAAFTTPVAGSPFTGITATSYAPAGLSGLTTYYFKVKALNSTCISDYLTGSFTTTCIDPAAPVALPQSFCTGATAAELTATGAAGATLNWLSPTGGVVVATDVLTTGTYTVTQSLNGCTSVATNVTVTVNAIPAIPTAVASQSFCTGATAAELNATAATGATLNWLSPSGTVVTATDVLVNGTYTVSQTANGCTSAAANVVITVNAIPALPLADAAQSFCAGTTAADLDATSATGATLNWFSPLGAAVTATDVLVNGTYTVSQTANSCTSAAANVVVTINAIPALPVADAAQSFCAGTTAADLDATSATGATLNWLLPSGAVVTATDVLVNGTYTVSQTANGCTSAAANVVVTINAIPALPVADATQSFCAGTTAADLDATAATGATLNWSSPSGAVVIATDVLVNGTYTVSQTANGCTSAAANIVVTVNAIPAAPSGNAEQDFTAGETLADLEITIGDGNTAEWFILVDGVYESVPESTELVDGTTYYVSQTSAACTSTVFAVTANEALGAESFDLTGLVVYPNPATSAVNIKGNTNIIEVVVFNVLGQEVIRQKASGQMAIVDISALAQGTYTVHIFADGASTAKTIIKN
jgi:hypothetical protein